MGEAEGMVCGNGWESLVDVWYAWEGSWGLQWLFKSWIDIVDEQCCAASLLVLVIPWGNLDVIRTSFGLVCKQKKGNEKESVTSCRWWIREQRAKVLSDGL
jgi:hypothetical protein